MTVPASRNELLSAISLAFDILQSELARIPEDRVHECSMPGHTTGTLMTPAHLISYLLGWNTLALKWLQQDDLGIAVDFPETGYKWNQLGRLVQKFYADYAELSWIELTEQLTGVKTALTATIVRRSEAELYGSPW